MQLDLMFLRQLGSARWVGKLLILSPAAYSSLEQLQRASTMSRCSSNRYSFLELSVYTKLLAL